jgi:succinate-semialdehyde dehydrogenase/glutarate-semialdehyde dehydrogenase
MHRDALPFVPNDSALIRTEAFIDGAWTGAASGARFAVTNPSTGELVAEVANCSALDAQAAIDAAAAAFEVWKRKTAKERAGVMRKWFELILAHQDDLARLMATEGGKALPEARGEIVYGASFIEWFAEEARRVTGDVLESPWANTRMLTFKQPIGVCAAITPWNFPHAMITRKVAPAIAAGCTIVLKPAEQTPLSALALAELAIRAGFPKGVINIVTADAANSIEVGKVLCASPVVRKLSFTGSTPVGRILMAQSAPTVKKLSLELGGHAPFIVFEDADINAAVAGAIASKYRNAGQTCVCTNRFFVHETVYEEFVARFTEKARLIKVGNVFAEGVTQGPLIEQQGIDKVESHVNDAVAKGARLLLGGKKVEGGAGLFYAATVLADATPDMQIAREETFGPVAAIFKFKDEADVIRLANDTEFGLASYFYSRDIARVWRVAEALDYGMVGVNTGILGNEVAPFGGVKQSGLGREGSRYGMDDYLEIKYVALGGM